MKNQETTKPYPKASAIILAGGQSTRMKKDKAMLPVLGAHLIEKVAQNLRPYFAEIIISTQTEGLYPFLPYTVVTDKSLGQGPLMGILCGLEVSSHPVNFVIACDIPEVNGPFLFQLMADTEAYEIVVPSTGVDKLEPLFAFYHQNLIPRIRQLLNQGTRKILDLYPLAKTKIVPMTKNDWFYNLNTTDDYQRYLEGRKLGN